ncbi:peptidyl-prolyl cis-trans isomerase [Acrasis kona]|uniref:peptidylprolyl isomerase n=1 Tax=Acrasis kona TaxID=1008807 RepID=A0AAW2ZBZ2_9EUKA
MIRAPLSRFTSSLRGFSRIGVSPLVSPGVTQRILQSSRIQTGVVGSAAFGVALYSTAKNVSAEEKISLTSDEGVVKTIITQGEGESPKNGSTVQVHYTGTFQNGQKFDSSKDRNKLFEFRLGAGQVIKGWDIGVASMKKGEKSVFVLRPEYAYGERGVPRAIPGNSTLVFEVELFGWK